MSTYLRLPKDSYISATRQKHETG